MSRILDVFRRDPVFAASLILAVLSAFLVPPSGKYIAYLDLRVLSLLLSLMLVVAGLRRAGAFDLLIKMLLKYVHQTRGLSALLVGACFFTSMLITNDVALITFVPLTLMLLHKVGKEKLLIPVIVLQTVAANLGSSLTPLGNPQNLYLYSLSGMNLVEFIQVMAFPTGLALVLLAGAHLFIPTEQVSLPEEEQTERSSFLPWLVLFGLCLLTVLHILHYALVLVIVLAAVCVLDRKLLRMADYNLLLTFIFFFIFIGNMKEIPVIYDALSGLVAGREMTVGILLSQIISNVPAAMLLSGFTGDYGQLLLGVNLGGLGTLIASMASMISYKLYAASSGAETGRYLAVFTGVNLLFLAVIWFFTALIY